MSLYDGVQHNLSINKNVKDLIPNLTTIQSNNLNKMETLNNLQIKNYLGKKLSDDDKKLLQIRAMWDKSGCSNSSIVTDDYVKNGGWWAGGNFPSRAANDMHAYCTLTDSGRATSRQKGVCGNVSKCATVEEILESGKNALRNTEVSSAEREVDKLENILKNELSSTEQRIEFLNSRYNFLKRNRNLDLKSLDSSIDTVKNLEQTTNDEMAKFEDLKLNYDSEMLTVYLLLISIVILIFLMYRLYK